jgi:phenylacetate-CoA ligase
MKRTNLRPSLWDRLQFIALGPRDLLLKLICMSYRSFIWGFSKLPPRYMAWTSRMRGKRALYRAVRQVPAYAKFLETRGATHDMIPETDKDSYIKAFPPEMRCRGGQLSLAHTMIDESAGSTGTPYNWVRSIRERHDMHLFISYFASYCFGLESWVTINAFSMGAWATGHNMGLALQKNSIVKNTGPDISKILSTMEFFGNNYTYLIMGYPPFLKYLIDEAESQGFPLGDYRMNGIAGGEGMSEGLRDYLMTRFQKVYSGYGATDLEIGVAGETPLSVAIRRLARDNPIVREKLFGNDSRLPMLFQYNPLMHYVEVNENRELVVTITRSSLLSPRIRYNVHDEGGVARYDEMAMLLASAGFDIGRLARGQSGERPFRFPFLWVYGRRDYTISVMGANIYPEDLEQCLYADRELARLARSYCLSLYESPEEGVRPFFLFEIEGEPNEELTRRFSESILQQLLKLNADFREAWREYPAAMVPKIQLFGLGQGPFKKDDLRIKQIRFLKKI